MNRKNRLPATSSKPAAKSSHEVRIIGGQFKKSKLPVADKPGLRPTPDRVRETLFNWLGHDLTGWVCIDVFSGTGALGLEAASRGAARVQLVESDPVLARQLDGVTKRLGATTVQVVRGDGLACLRQTPAASQDLILVDPPFDSSLFEPALHAAARAVKPLAYVYLEAPVRWDEGQLDAIGLHTCRYLKAGAVHAHLLQGAASAPASSLRS